MIQKEKESLIHQVAQVTKCNSNIDESENEEEEQASKIHYRKGKEGLLEMCIVRKNEREEIVPTPDYAYEYESEDSQKA